MVNDGKSGAFHRERIGPLQELGYKKIAIVPGDDKNVSRPLTSLKGSTFFSFFTFSKKDEARRKSGIAAFKESVLKSPRLHISRTHLSAVKNWAALEEKIVHDYTGQKAVSPKSSSHPAKNPEKQPLPAMETFTTRTAVPSLPSASKIKKSLRGSKRVFSGVAGLFLACGWLAAGVFIFLYLQQPSSSRGISRKLAQLQDEKARLEQSYAALKSSSENQSAEMKWQNRQLRDVAMQLRKAKAEKAAYEQGLEKKYSEELMRITVGYETELTALRGTVQTQNAVVSALKAQSQAFDKIVDQVGMSALSGAAAGFSQGTLSTEGTLPQGVVTSVNKQNGSLVFSMGEDQGARSGHWITISRNGVELAAGLIDRVYNTMSVAKIQDAGMLQLIQEGDSVSFS